LSSINFGIESLVDALLFLTYNSFVFGKEYISILPSKGNALKAKLFDCIDQLTAILAPKESLVSRILKLTLFIHSEDNADFQRKRYQVTRILKDFFRGDLPPFSIIAQPPEGGFEVALYTEALSPETVNATIHYKLTEEITYCSVQYGSYREVYGAGLTVGNRLRGTRNQSTAAFQLMKHILEKEQMVLGDIVRQWNYIEDILHIRPTPSGNRQNYQEFNDVRHQFYSDSFFPAGFPAATGIGMKHGGVVLEFQALLPSDRLDLVPLSNPLQIDAHRYSQEVLVGDPQRKNHPKASPLFERGKYLGLDTSGIIYISGTAAVREQATSPEKDIESQTRITIENILKLISENNLRNHGIEISAGPCPLSYLRAYVRHREDLPVVKKICQQSFGNVPSNYLMADICRDDLLVELEGVVSVNLKNKK
jgi:enamine deaminase RidA (YjgF/YER057c/UK114 family)